VIGASAVQTAILTALARFGELTIREICELLSLERTHVFKRLLQMQRKQILINFCRRHRYCRSNTSTPPAGLEFASTWTIDPRHPYFTEFVSLGVALAIDFPWPGKPPVVQRRRFSHLPKNPKLTLSDNHLRIMGDSAVARSILLLAHVPELCISRLRELLGISRNTIFEADPVVTFGILGIKWSNGKYERARGRSLHVVYLNPAFCAYQALRKLSFAIDDATGGEFRWLARAYLDGAPCYSQFS
jgi:hypothetical protein